jgi:catechol 2,3-dioxygenase-like lactoylglutathione lyase family enzyme
MSVPAVRQQITFFPTQDLEKTADFYESRIGLDLVLDQGKCRIYRISPEGYLGFCQQIEAKPESAGVVFTLVTPQVDDWYEYLKARGVKVEDTPKENPTYQIYHFFFRDPNGYLIEVQEFLDPRWNA